MPRNPAAQTAQIIIPEAQGADFNSAGRKEWERETVEVKPGAHLAEVNGDKNPDSLKVGRVQVKKEFYKAEQRVPEIEIIFLLFIDKKIVPVTVTMETDFENNKKAFMLQSLF